MYKHVAFDPVIDGNRRVYAKAFFFKPSVEITCLVIAAAKIADVKIRYRFRRFCMRILGGIDQDVPGCPYNPNLCGEIVFQRI